VLEQAKWLGKAKPEAIKMLSLSHP